LAKLFGSRERTKLLRLFIFNSNLYFSQPDLKKRTKIGTTTLRRELELLEEIGFATLKKLTIAPIAAEGKKKTKNTKAGLKSRVWSLNPDFLYLEHLKSIFNTDFLAGREELAERFKNCGKVKLLVLSGIFLQDGGTRADLLIVGDELRRSAIESVISAVEAEIGRELVYATLDTRDYIYRLNTSDRFLRDVLDYPHKALIDRLTVQE